MAYGVDQFIFVTARQQMYYNTTGTMLSLFEDQYLVAVSDGLLTYFTALPENTPEDIRDCYDGAFYNNTAPLGTGGPYNG